VLPVTVDDPDADPGDTERPAGTPGATIVKGAWPPTILIVWLYASPAVAFGNVLRLKDGSG
jgi:hypothetical protein